MKVVCFMTEYQEGKIRLAKLEVVIMPNGEILCGGKHIAWLNEKIAGCITGNDITFKNYIEEIEGEGKV